MNCKFCGKETKNNLNSLSNHQRLCKLNPERQVNNYQIFCRTKKSCKFCNKEILVSGISAHQKFCLSNPEVRDRKRKICPVCSNEYFKPENLTCSTSCANTLTRTGPFIRKYKEDNYRQICFFYHQKKCIVCNETKVVDVHHHDSDRTNNHPTNLIPLCPTHHRYWHSRYRKDVKENIENYIKIFIKSNVWQNFKDIKFKD